MFTINVPAILAVSPEAPTPAVPRPLCLGTPVNLAPFRKGAVKFGTSCKLSATCGHSHWLCVKESDQACYSLRFWRRDVIALTEHEASALRPVPRTEWCSLPHTCPVWVQATLLLRQQCRAAVGLSPVWHRTPAYASV